jgi:hypothetical protein
LGLAGKLERVRHSHRTISSLRSGWSTEGHCQTSSRNTLRLLRPRRDAPHARH